MKTVVITGGTDGIGRALASELLGEGATVIVVGRNPAKGRDFLTAADKAGSADRARFVTADLSLLAETEKAVAEIRAEIPVVDALVLCARHYRSRRTVTSEGLEENFALFYLSRRLFGQGLADALAAAEAPVVVNVAGPGAPLDIVRWDDLQLRHGYHGGAALGQGGKLNDLLGIAFSERHGGRGIRYVLVHPGVTATGFSGEYDQATLPHIRSMQAGAKPVSAALPPILSAIERPPAAALSAFVEGRELDVSGPDFDPAAARRLEALTERLLAARRDVRSR
ncbi:NAD(P)-dependent dehydrogenase, short-chain alcohol dehydrogenase family [Streptosporangium subroseum]|uniref:NAD(P)-dependent dehydrogenase, short-chain alcohol dehydrogenase family n=1 Tax=Streptosporangium subroseum TaxID=106412 RepID=A0A239MLW4_9ACTN|nr:SDR family NAD(P)-dependent oxidoreductase [Streptosporangium subroseum]SNT42819.1 NAD(P)-dependent dehydrogenase, short-chain alcohol dehydrogenase family [Streptosporangium subroseum]